MGNPLNVLFRSRQEVEILPSIHGGDTIPEPFRARRWQQAKAWCTKPPIISSNLVKAVIAMVIGNVQKLVVRTPDQISVLLKSASDQGSYALAIDGATWILPHGITYHVGVLGLAEALARPAAAVDLLDAWEDLLTTGQQIGWQINKPALKGSIMRVADETYYWLRYGAAQTISPGVNRFENQIAVIEGSGTIHPGPNLAQLLLDLGAFQQRRLDQGPVPIPAIVYPLPVEVRTPVAPNLGEEAWQRLVASYAL